MTESQSTNKLMHCKRKSLAIRKENHQYGTDFNPSLYPNMLKERWIIGVKMMIAIIG